MLPAESIFWRFSLITKHFRCGIFHSDYDLAEGWLISVSAVASVDFTQCIWQL